MRSANGHGQRRPIIAMTPDVSLPTSESPLPRYELRCAYTDAVLRAGGLPFIVPYTDDRQVIEAVLDRVSAVVVTGGGFDIAPELYGQSPKPGLGVIKPQRTSFEMALLKEALARNMPLLGICGGMQLLNVALGGTLVQDIATELPQARPHQQTHDRTQPQHPVDVVDGSLLCEHFGKGQLMVNSTHHQSVDKPGADVVVSAAAPDGVVEAIECRKYRFALGVQWHPELLVDTMPLHQGLFRALVAKAKDQRR